MATPFTLGEVPLPERVSSRRLVLSQARVLLMKRWTLPNNAISLWEASEEKMLYSSLQRANTQLNARIC